MFKRWIILVGMVLLVSSVVYAQEEIVLEPFTDENYGIEAVKPEGWSQVGPGLYARGSSATDIALVALQSAPVNVDLLWGSLLPQFGLDEVPESVGTYETDTFTWTLHQFEVAAVNGAFDISTAEGDGVTYLVLLQATPDEYEALHETVFLPILDSYTTLEADEEDVPYIVEEVTFDNCDITLSGTLTIPDVDGQHPAVVMMTGSGGQTRDEIVVPGFPIFKLIADHLTREGIAVLRYDDRGVGKSEGDILAAGLFDFASDGKAAVAYLQTRDDINSDQVGLFGHSEGGAYSAILGADPDSGIAFIVSMAGIGVSGADVLLLQNELILAASGEATEEVIAERIAQMEVILPLVIERDFDEFARVIDELAREEWASSADELREATGLEDVEAYVEWALERNLSAYQNEAMITLLGYDPVPDWEQTTVPVLGLFGELDLQVDPDQNLPPMQAALEAAGNEDITFVVLDKANHLFQEATTGNIDEYSELPPEFVEEFLPLVTDWLHERVDVVVE